MAEVNKAVREARHRLVHAPSQLDDLVIQTSSTVLAHDAGIGHRAPGYGH